MGEVVARNIADVISNTEGISDQDRIVAYMSFAESRWKDWRAEILKKQIVDSDGVIHPVPDPGPFHLTTGCPSRN